ncbi:MAG: hypothetical protein P8163_17840 [Candidatus Thiodiazotropha sp.]
MTLEAGTIGVRIGKNYNWIVLLLITIVLSSCGGGDGGGGEQPNDDDNDTPPSVDNNLNNDLAGRLYISDRGVFLDLSTGSITEIASDDSYISPSLDGTEYIEIIKKHHVLDDDECWSDIGIDRIAIRDVNTNLLLDSFDLYEHVWSIPDLSPDKQAVALLWANDKGCPDDAKDLLTVFDRKGNIISQTNMEVRTHDWLPDNRLAYFIDDTLYISSAAYQVNGQAILSVNHLAGKPARLRVNPQGTKIVFEMVTGGPGSFLETASYRYATVWMVNADGSDLHLYATSRHEVDSSGNADEPKINNPVWSLDGENILLTEGYFSGIAGVTDPFDLNPEGELFIPLGVYGLTYILPTTASDIRLPPNNDIHGAILSVSGNDGPSPYIVSCDSLPYIAPVSSDIDETPGSLPQEGGHNRGIGGSIYFINESNDETVISSLRVDTGEINDIVTLASDHYGEYSFYFSMSADAQYFSFYDLEDLYEEYIKIVSVNGEILKSYNMYDDRYEIRQRGRIQFSPVNSDLITFEYIDTDNGNKHVAIFDWRQGQYLRTFVDGYYSSPTWTPDGNLIIWDENHTSYLVTVTADQLGNPTALFSLPEASILHAVNPNGDSMAFKMAGHVWTINLDGTDLKPITAPYKGYESFPAWSPDGRYLVVKRLSWDGSMKKGSLWIAAADAKHLQLRNDSNNVIPIRKSDGYAIHDVHGPLTWLP